MFERSCCLFHGSSRHRTLYPKDPKGKDESGGKGTRKRSTARGKGKAKAKPKAKAKARAAKEEQESPPKRSKKGAK